MRAVIATTLVANVGSRRVNLHKIRDTIAARAAMRRSAGVSATAGAIFHGTRIPLTVWLATAWHMANGTQGGSALGLKHALEIGSPRPP